jgi:sucrose-phosphate synthase
MNNKSSKLYIALISLHGLITGEPELGRDADTGGQVSYVLNLAKALSKHPDVEMVHLITRRICDDKPCYGEVMEALNDTEKCFIVRVDCADNVYIRKEKLWVHIPEFVENCVKLTNQLVGRQPNIIHSHYADAGHVAMLWSQKSHVPFVHTGHSLGKDKLRSLLSMGYTNESAKKEFNIHIRIETEEKILTRAKFIIVSTEEEINNQYKQYNNFNQNKFLCIPPSIDMEDFRNNIVEEPVPSWVKKNVNKFLRNPELPIILTVSRANPKKNIEGLIHAYANSELKNVANLVLIMGTRKKIKDIKDKETKKTLKEVLYLIDDYDLYDRVAYPKFHTKKDLISLYKYTAKKKGVFVNAAHMEPFGLTLLEASIFGIPLIATKNGGPVDIIKQLKNGRLVDPANWKDIASAISDILLHKGIWDKYHKNGLDNIDHYSWDSHANVYIDKVNLLLKGPRERDEKREFESKRLEAKVKEVSQSSPLIKNDMKGRNPKVTYTNGM